jgi:hypothetical protein
MRPQGGRDAEPQEERQEKDLADAPDRDDAHFKLKGRYLILLILG